ncbi:fimbria/pilus outer membrane usher protein, partial [Burkholderia sp. Ac-20349]|uniref:fimbria/pilus outer membrane usher protein n=1 Tax=Burkholderia sp. Ac-20349 TaxID=2703893 RepID=UPI00197C42D4
AIVGHAGGLTLANDLGETSAIVEAKDAVGAQIMNGTDVRIDRRGVGRAAQGACDERHALGRRIG